MIAKQLTQHVEIDALFREGLGKDGFQRLQILFYNIEAFAVLFFR
jgi:hypothetical protein